MAVPCTTTIHPRFSLRLRQRYCFFERQLQGVAVNRYAAAVCMYISASKTKVMPAEQHQAVLLGGEPLEVVYNSIFITNGQGTEEIILIFPVPYSLVCSPVCGLSLDTNGRVFQAVMQSILLHG